MSTTYPVPVAPAGTLADLTAAVRAELEAFDYPSGSWTVPRTDANGERVLDVLVIGAGQAGISTALRLRREGVDNLLVVDAAPAGREGPWVTWARMRTLRTVKHLHGTEGGIRSASFRYWFDAVRGAGAFDTIDLIPREDWMAYLTWLRETTGIPVRNETTVVTVRPEDGHWRVVLDTAGERSSVATRKVVACTGMDGAGGPSIPPYLADLGPGGWAHSSETIDWEALRGARVAVIGVGASAFDNAAVALESGSASVVQFGRRDSLPTQNPFRYLEKKGLFRAYHSMSDESKLGFARLEFSRAVPPTAHSLDRCRVHENYTLALGVSFTGATRSGNAIVLQAGDDTYEFDFVIAGTGFVVDLSRIDWLSEIAGEIRTWGDVYELGDHPTDRVIAAHPYLGTGMRCLPRTPESPAAVADLHLFNLAAHVSYGISCIGLNGLPWAVSTVVDAICADLVAADAEDLLAGFAAYDSADTLTPGALTADAAAGSDTSRKDSQ